MTQPKIRKGTFHHIESELYAYNDTRKEIVKLKNELLQAHGERTATLIIMHRTVEQMERITEAIENVVEQLPPEKQALIKMLFWTRPQLLTWDGIAMELNVGRTTAIRWRDEIIFKIAEKLGWR
ncbi:transcriptional regulator [Paenibacillus oleatilyticus]|uniref:transcriptional regulator n=1 Tax=Paenibacillus oleatilyticus TaxID=2594886 RepID=UPI001C1FD7DE|nr:transcriptional regulator [Paenibacillus oleatilyticus]MBU7320290.1 transcriptional regulator [Paenibacillus oleatilyticus]